jgi:flagellar assembly protein FliH
MLVIKNGEQSLAYSPLILPDAGNLVEGSRSSLLSQPAQPAQEEPIARHLGLAALAEDPVAIVEKARAEAAEIIAEAHARALLIEREAGERVMLEARTAVHDQGAAEIEPMRVLLSESLEEIAMLREQIAAYAESEMVQLAVEIAKKIVRREVTVDREIVVSLARVALARLHNRALASVHLHPDDYEYVLAHRDRLGTATSVKLVEDPMIGRGGCLIETDLGQVDARIEQQFNEIERGFLQDVKP